MLVSNQDIILLTMQRGKGGGGEGGGGGGKCGNLGIDSSFHWFDFYMMPLYGFQDGVRKPAWAGQGICYQCYILRRLMGNR